MKFNIKKAIEKRLSPKTREELLKPLFVKLLLSPNRSSVIILIMFLFSRKIDLSFGQKWKLVKRFNYIHNNIENSHSFDELLIPAYHILSLPRSIKGCIVEAGAFKGCSSAKLSLIANLCDRKLYIFDSFEGLPDHDDPIAHTTMGYNLKFNKGDYFGTLDEVKKNIQEFGEIKMCKFVKGWFENTMPNFKEDVVAVFCDVDLESSNKTCIKFLWPRLVNKGFFFSQDAHIPIIIKLFSDKTFWNKEVGEENVPRFYSLTKRFGYFKKTYVV